MSTNRLIRFKNRNYTTISNVFLRDMGLSLKAKGLLSLVMSLPEDCDFTVEGIVVMVKEGKTAIYSAIDELKQSGYCVVSVVRNNRGVIQGTDYKFYETPCVGNPQVENPHTENLNVDKKGIITSNIIITDNTKTATIDKDNNQRELSLFTGSEDIKKEIKEKKSIQKKEKKKDPNDLFEQCWVAYRRKGSKKKAKEQWVKLSEKERSCVMPHIRAYVSSRELVYQRDFERYLRDKVFLDVVFQGKSIIYDPSVGIDEEYRPATDGQIHWNEQMGCWLFTGFDESCIFDGYDDNNRPNGAEIRMNNGRGIVVWNSTNKCWEKKK